MIDPIFLSAVVVSIALGLAYLTIVVRHLRRLSKRRTPKRTVRSIFRLLLPPKKSGPAK